MRYLRATGGRCRTASSDAAPAGSATCPANMTGFLAPLRTTASQEGFISAFVRVICGE